MSRTQIQPLLTKIENLKIIIHQPTEPVNGIGNSKESEELTHKMPEPFQRKIKNISSRIILSCYIFFQS